MNLKALKVALEKHRKKNHFFKNLFNMKHPLMVRVEAFAAKLPKQDRELTCFEEFELADIIFSKTDEKTNSRYAYDWQFIESLKADLYNPQGKPNIFHAVKVYEALKEIRNNSALFRQDYVELIKGAENPQGITWLATAMEPWSDIRFVSLFAKEKSLKIDCHLIHLLPSIRHTKLAEWEIMRHVVNTRTSTNEIAGLIEHCLFLDGGKCLTERMAKIVLDSHHDKHRMAECIVTLYDYDILNEDSLKLLVETDKLPYSSTILHNTVVNLIDLNQAKALTKKVYELANQNVSQALTLLKCLVSLQKNGIDPLTCLNFYEKKYFYREITAVLIAFHKACVLEQNRELLVSKNLASIYPSIKQIEEANILRQEVVKFVCEAPMGNRCDIALALHKAGLCEEMNLTKLDGLSNLAIYYAGQRIVELAANKQLNKDSLPDVIKFAEKKVVEDVSKQKLFKEKYQNQATVEIKSLHPAA